MSALSFETVIVTGGAGFVGSNLAIKFKQAHPDARIVAVDSLKRRGSELTLSMLRDAGVEFVHADIRCPEDLAPLPECQLLIDCSAEPSVQAGVGGSPLYVLNTNLVGTMNLLEVARVHGAAFLFLSTSRIYPMAPMNDLRFEEGDTRFTWSENQDLPGCGPEGISEAFPLEGPRSLYGASKLAGELLLQEYVYNYGMRGIINRCGVLTGPWQMGKVDQGVVTLWMARHYFGKPLSYIGYGGTGKQVRDVLHVDDLFQLVQRQLAQADAWDGRVYNVGGGVPVSVSLAELTAHCREITGKSIDIASKPETSSVDLRIYLTDCAKVKADFGWAPKYDVPALLADIHDWLREHETALRPILS